MSVRGVEGWVKEREGEGEGGKGGGREGDLCGGRNRGA